MKKWICLLALIATAGSSFASTLPFDETFETNSLGSSIDGVNGWTAGDTNAAVITNTTYSGGGSKALAITETTVVNTFTNTATQAWVTFWANPNPATEANGPLTDASAVFYVSTNGNKLVAYSNTVPIELSATVSNGWNKFETFCDYSSQKWSLKLNGALVVDEYAFYSSNSSLTSLEFTDQATNATLIVDSITATDLPFFSVAPVELSLSADINVTVTNSEIVITNSSAIPLTCTFANAPAWLTVPSPLVVAPGTASNLTVSAVYPSQTNLTQKTFTATYSQTNKFVGNSEFETFTVDFAVGARIMPLLPPVFTDGIGGVVDGEYEPEETFTVTLTSTNNGAIPVSNIVNTLTLPSGWGNPSPASDLYGLMLVGDTTSTTYTVTIPAGTANGNYTFTVENAADGSSWSDTFTMDVYNRANPSATTNAVTIYVPVGGTASESITLTNAGNAATTFTLSDNGSWPLSYLVSTQTASLVTFLPVFDTPDTNTTFIDWEGDDTNLTVRAPIGFNFPFYGDFYSEFQVNSYGNLLLLTTEALMPYWGNVMSDADSVRYKKEADRLVVAWNNDVEENEFQAWLYADGRIRYVYDGALADHDERGIGLMHLWHREYIHHTPGAQESLLFTPSPEPWVTYSPITGTLNEQSIQTITYTADAADQTDGTRYVFTNTVTWADGSPATEVVVTVQVGGDANAGIAVADVFFSGPAGFISEANMTLVNTGDVALIYRITDTGVRDAGYAWERIPPPFNWDDSNWDTHSGEFVPTDTDEGYSDLIPIGFNFYYYGNVYTQLSIGVNGAVSLGNEQRLMTATYMEDTNPGKGPNNRTWEKRINTLSATMPKTNWIETADTPSIPDPEFIDIPDELIAACWHDFVYDLNASIRYSGNANQLVISWENMAHTFAGVDQTFQMILNRDGTIIFQYEYLNGSDVWPDAVVGLRDGGGAWTTPAHLLFPHQETIPGTVIVTTNYNTTTNWMKWDGSITNWAHPEYDTEIIITNSIDVITTPGETVEEQAIRFYPSNRVVITVDPTFGTLPYGGTAVHTVYGDARSLAAPGGESVPVNTTFNIDYGFGTEPVSVLFFATNSADAGYSPLSVDSDGDGMSDAGELMFGSDGVVSVEQNPDGSRTLSWPEPSFTPPNGRNFIVWYTTDLTIGWSELAQLGNATSYTDVDHADEPVIYYRVTVE